MRFKRNPKKVLIVGGRGFIGSHLSISGAECYDLKDGFDIRNGLDEEYGTIVLLAANLTNTPEGYMWNEQIYKGLDSYMEEYPDTHVIYTSSAAVYGEWSNPVNELDFTYPYSKYGESKLQGECYIRQYRRHTILRLSNVHGKGGSGVIDLFKSGRRTIYGKGTQVRDYVPVESVAQVIKEAVKHPDRFFGVTNVSTGVGMTTKQIYKLYGGTKRILYTKERVGDVEYSVLDNGRLLDLMQW